MKDTGEHYKSRDAFRAHAQKNVEKYADQTFELHHEHVVRETPTSQTTLSFGGDK